MTRNTWQDFIKITINAHINDIPDSEIYELGSVVCMSVYTGFYSH